MIHHIYEFNREKVSKKQYHRHHAETHFEDPVRGDFFNYFTQKGLPCVWKAPPGEG